MVQWLIKIMGSLVILGLEGGYTVVDAGVCTSSLIPGQTPPSKGSEGKGSSELGLNPSFLVYGARQQGHAKVGSDWSLWHVIATRGKATRLEPDWSAKLNSLHSYTVMLHSYGKFVK